MAEICFTFFFSVNNMHDTASAMKSHMWCFSRYNVVAVQAMTCSLTLSSFDTEGFQIQSQFPGRVLVKKVISWSGSGS